MTGFFWFVIGIATAVAGGLAGLKARRKFREFIGGESFEAECERRFWDHEIVE